MPRPTVLFEAVFEFSLPGYPRIPTTWALFVDPDCPMIGFCQRVAKMTGYNLRDLSFKAGREGNHCVIDAGGMHPTFEENSITAEETQSRCQSLRLRSPRWGGEDTPTVMSQWHQENN